MRPLIFVAVLFFSFAPVASAVPAGGACTGTSECNSGLTCVQGTCQNVPPGGNPGVFLNNPLSAGTSLPAFLNSILDFVIRIGTIVVILMVVYVGFMFVTAQGNETKLTTARRALLWTIVGALILLGAKAISLAIQSTVNAIT